MLQITLETTKPRDSKMLSMQTNPTDSPRMKLRVKKKAGVLRWEGIVETEKGRKIKQNSESCPRSGGVVVGEGTNNAGQPSAAYLRNTLTDLI